MTENTRVRFAPSPTGSLHLGGARTAIYNWLFARSVGGKFLLRIEDTDVERSRKELVNQICDSLQWLGLNWDEEPVFQSQRLELYQQKVTELLKAGKAYRCFCSSEELEAEKAATIKQNKAYRYSGKCRSLSLQQSEELMAQNKPYTVRIKLEPGIIEWDDLVYGHIAVNNNELDDFIIQRSNGIPVYQMAVVVDDIDMRITHIIRGEDHIPNTPKQINLFRAFGQPIPQFAHLPLLLGPDNKRLSKRHGATGVDEYREQGFPAEAVVNYLALLGWAPQNDQEVLSIDEIIQQFQLTAISRKPAVFDIKKLEWISGEHLNRMPVAKIRSVLVPKLIAAGLINQQESENRTQYVDSVIELLRGRVRTYNQYLEWGCYFFQDPENYDEKAAAKYWHTPETNEHLAKLSQELATLTDFSANTIEETLRRTAEHAGLKAADLIHPLRLALTGFGISPGIFKVAEILGKETVLRRIQKAIEYFKT
ncbi:MAG TPA: glutamate--tRNA ligase [Candidatus Marinimicrobia bacterium]|nr:glutamate--tRNA ligase [Candidatus Neomarinimicrobiota bacterium]